MKFPFFSSAPPARPRLVKVRWLWSVVVEMDRVQSAEMVIEADHLLAAGRKAIEIMAPHFHQVRLAKVVRKGQIR